jgi:hypothetical protein
MRLAVIGDFGSDSSDELHVAQLVDGAHPDFILSVGDNDYSSELGLMRSRATYDRFVGKYYGRYLADDAAQNRFWPVPGNHDWYVPVDIQPYLDYFAALPRTPAAGRYYEVLLGSVHLFALDSDDHEPDGRSVTSTQAAWLKAALAASTACHKIVFFHHPPYSSGRTDMYFVRDLRWPFANWGADVVLSGHEHFYERSEVDGLPYFISGLGGFSKFDFLTNPPPPESRARYNEDYGALFIDVNDDHMTYRFNNVAGNEIDTLTVTKHCPS